MKQEIKVSSWLVIIKTNHKIAAHYAISSSSQIFSSMFEQGKFKEGLTTTIVEIEDINIEVFRQLLQFLYAVVAPEYNSPVITKQLFLAAGQYQVYFLENHARII